MANEKFCKDCRWFSCAAGKLERCGHEKATNPQGADDYVRWLVDGNGDPPDRSSQYACVVMRKYDCGIDGKLWEPIVVARAA